MNFLYVMNTGIAIAFSVMHLFGSFFLSESILNSNIFEYILAIMSAIVLASMMFEKFKLYIQGRINMSSIFLAVLVLIINIIAIRVNSDLFFFSMFPVYLISVFGRYFVYKLMPEKSSMQVGISGTTAIESQRFNRARALFIVLSVAALYGALSFVEGWMIIILAMNICRAILLLSLDMRYERILSGKILFKNNSGQEKEYENQVQKEQIPLSTMNACSILSFSNLLYSNVLLFVCVGVGFITSPFLLAVSLLSLGMLVFIPLFLLPALLLIWLFLRILRKQAGITTYVFFGLILLLMTAVSNGLFFLIMIIVVLIYLIMHDYFPNFFDRYLNYRDFKQ